MGTGYTRNDTSNNIADGNVINAADFDGEYDAIEAAFNSSSGHTHDGTSAEGAPVTVLGPNQEFVATSSAVNPSTNASLDLGTASLKFKDLYIDGTAYIDGFAADILTATDKKVQFRDAAIFINSSTDGQLDIDADTTIELNSPEVIATDDFRLKSDSAILTFGADNDVTVTHVADTGLDAQAASGFVLKLQTGDTTVESGNTLGKISFNAPSEASGTDAILVGAEIEAAAEATFSSTVNSTALIFKTNTTAAATERMRITSDGKIGINNNSPDSELHISGSGNDAKIILEGSANPRGNFIATEGADDLVFAADEDNLGADSAMKFRIDAAERMIITNAGNIGMGTSSPTSDLHIVSSAAGTQLTLESTDAGAADGPIIQLYRNSASPAADDDIGRIDFQGENSSGSALVYARIDSFIETPTAGSEDGRMRMILESGGGQKPFIDMDASAGGGDGRVSINAGTDDIDLQVRGDTEANLIYADASTDRVGIGTATPASLLHLYTTAPELSFTDSNSFTDVNDRFIVRASTDRGNIQWYDDSAGTTAELMTFLPTSVVVNESSGDIDFRVESNDRSHMFFVDAANNRIGINNNGPETTLHVTETTAPAILRLHRSGATNAANAVLGQLEFFNADGSSDGPNVTAKITGSTHGSSGQGGNLRFFTHDGTETGGEGSDPVERVRITGTGKVGIGTTDPSQLLHIAGDGNIAIKLDSTSTGGDSWRIFSNDDTSSQGGGSMAFYNEDNAVYVLNLQSSGNVGIGTSAPTNTFEVKSSGDNANEITLQHSGNTVDIVQLGQSGGHGNMYLYQNNGLAGVQLSATEGNVFNENSVDADFRIESNGNTHAFYMDAGSEFIAMGNSANQLASGFADQHGFSVALSSGQTHVSADGTALVVGRTTTGGSGTLCDFRLEGTQEGSIHIDASGVNYLTVSDRRLKTDIKPITNGTDKLMAMNPVTHGWKSDPNSGKTVHGFIAQEMQEIVPEAVSGETDGEEMMQMDYGRITPVLVAALQDTHKKIEALEKRLESLEV